MPSTLRRPLPLCLALAAALPGCGGDEGPPQPAALVVVSGNAQTAPVTAALEAPVVVRVTTKNGRGLEGVAVTWSVAGGGGVVAPLRPATDASGEAQATWTMGTAAGPAKLVVTAAGLPRVNLELTATAAAGPAAGIAPVAGDGQSGPAGDPLTTPIAVRVADAFDNPVRDAAVSFVTANGGTFAPPGVSTGEDGRAETRWTLGPAVGLQGATATVSGLAGVAAAFQATSIAGAPATIRITPRTHVLTGIGRSASFSAAVSDRHGNLVAGAPVTWRSLDPGVVSVDGNGMATTVGVGEGRITASIAAAADTVRVSVLRAPARLALAPASVTLQPGDSVTLLASATDSSGVGLPTPPLAWSTDNPAVATVSPGGLVRAVGNGAATITAVVQDLASVRAQAAVTVSTPATRITNGATLADLAGALNSQRLYLITIPAGATRLLVTTTGGAGDVDLFVRAGAPPTLDLATCVSGSPTAAETCIISAPQSGDWYIMLHGYTAYSGVTLRVTYDEPLPAGKLVVAITGLPAGTAGDVIITGPSGYRAALAQAQTLEPLVPGTYTVSAAGVAAGATYYDPAPLLQTVAVPSGGTASATVAYAPSAGLDLRIDGLYLTQATQTFEGTVPLVAGRPALLRVFARANHANTTAAVVRVRFFSAAGALLDTRTLASPGASAPTAISEGTLETSWNLVVPASLLVPGLQVLADIDPANAVPESDEQDNHYPASGTPLALDVRTAAPFQVMLVPVLQQGNGLLADLNAANTESYTTQAERLYPLSSIDAAVHVPYTFAGTIASSYDSTWSRLLSEMEALRAAEGSRRYYYGVLKPGYPYGGPGLGHLGFPAAVGVDWPSYRASTAAHEWGHNFNRRHVACGNPSNPDLGYPYADGHIGVLGYDLVAGQLRAPAAYFDLMSYCRPEWISDYTYRAVLSYRAAEAATAATTPEARGLLVWGRVEDGRVTLEPALEVSAPPRLPAGGGPYALEGVSATGQRLFGFSFDAAPIDHLEDARSFAFVVPLPAGESAASVRLLEGGRVAAELRSVSPPDAQGAPPVQASPSGAGRVRLTWDAQRYPLVLVRDAATGQVRSFARGGSAEVASTGAALDVDFSRGTASERRRVSVTR